MANTKALIARAYFAFNRRGVDGALACMSEEVSWPKASKGGRVGGVRTLFQRIGCVSGVSSTLT